MAFWNNGRINNIFEGTIPNDGTGDNIRVAFNKVDSNFSNISAQLGQFNQDWTNANVEYNFQATFANITNSFIANATGTTSNFTGNTSSANIIANTGLYSSGVTYLTGNTYVAAPIVPVSNGLYDLGSPTNRFRTVYSQTTNAATQIQSSSDSGILKVHANAFVGDVQDTGILGNITSEPGYTSNTYAFFGHQYSTNNFIYKITNNDATLGNNIVVGGVYGNVQFGSAFLSNATPSTNTATGALVVAGGAGIAGNLNIGGNINTTANIYSGGSQVLTVSSAGISNIYNGSGSIFTGNTVFPAATPSTSYSTGAVVIPNGGLGVFGNVVAVGFTGPLYGIVQTAAQPQITSLGTLTGLSLTNGSTLNASGISATSINVQHFTVTSDITASGIALLGLFSLGASSASISGNIVAGNVSASGNFSASYYLGNGSYLTGIPTVGQLQTLDANVGAYETWANSAISSTSSALQTLTANVGAFEITTNANIGGHQLAIASINANVGAYQIATNANIGAYEIATNANIGTVYNHVNTLDANVGAYEIATNANVGTIYTHVNTLDANVGSLGGNVGVVSYISQHALSVGGNLTVTGNILPSANSTVNMGDSTHWFGQIYGTAIHAQYADLAECYEADAVYEPGTVVVFGGDKDITTTAQFADTRVAGAVSTEPAYVMNGSSGGTAVALRGKVPVKFVGPVNKGDLLVTCGARPGYAISVGSTNTYGQAVFAKSLTTDSAEGEKIIIAVII